MDKRRVNHPELISVLIGEDIPAEHGSVLNKLEDPVRLEITPLRVLGAPGLLQIDSGLQRKQWRQTRVLSLFDSSLPENLLECFPGLEWIHLLGAGANRALNLDLFETQIQITNSRGVAARPAAEWVILSMLAFARHLPLLVRQQDRGIWDRPEPDEIYGKTVGLIGLGAIGHEVAQLTQGLGMRVIATRRHIEKADPPTGVDQIYPLMQLHDLITQSDFLVICVPLTAETRYMLGAEELAAMKPSGILINISRGGIVDEDALAMMLREDRIGGAALDVFEREPLPPDSPWWSMSNVLISPHQAGWSTHYWKRTLALLSENLQRYLDGRSLLNQLGEKGY